MTKVDVGILKGEEIGGYTIENNYVEPFIIEGDSKIGIAVYARSWWGCTRECISDVHIACHSDKQCSTMLWLTNVLSGFGRPRGVGGSASIGVACGAWCAYDSSADLLPQY